MAFPTVGQRQDSFAFRRGRNGQRRLFFSGSVQEIQACPQRDEDDGCILQDAPHDEPSAEGDACPSAEGLPCFFPIHLSIGLIAWQEAFVRFQPLHQFPELSVVDSHFFLRFITERFLP